MNNNLFNYNKSSCGKSLVSLSDILTDLVRLAVGVGVFAFEVWLAVVILRAMGVL